ncbi:hypothetical protein [Treponema pallidum]|uniref:hypothetical protein n=1 Tax=Treponema pallidum TaxID=160 RepID=UPI0039DF6697
MDCAVTGSVGFTLQGTLRLPYSFRIGPVFRYKLPAHTPAPLFCRNGFLNELSVLPWQPTREGAYGSAYTYTRSCFCIFWALSL